MIEVSIYKKLISNSEDMILDVNFNISKGKLVTLYGRSGAGKTSILKIIAGLVKPDDGHIEVNNIKWYDRENNVNLPTQKRNLGLVFQDYSLFPNMTVKENLTFALSKNQDKNIVKELIEIVDLGNLQNRDPGTLSGGQKQRVALARTLVQRPEILLLDEPLSALDDEMRIKLQKYILKVHQEFKLTTILISHDISEIIKMSDYLMEIDHGKIVSQGTPTMLFTNNTSGREVKLSGEVINIELHESMATISVLIGRDLIKIQTNLEEAQRLNIGKKVLITSEIFNPVISS